ncbi:MAG: hypothetical protein J5640_00015 [Bacteroidales bacterium]|nr:hypothetical protein [Bacteroidales bacterium]
MGLLKNLLNTVAGSVTGKTLDQVKEAVNNLVQNQAPRTSPVREPQPARQQYNPAPEVDRTDGQWKSYFREILQSDFAGYGIREDVPVTEIAGPAADVFQLYRTMPGKVYRAEWGQPYSFVLSQGGAPRAVVMLGSGHSHDIRVKYLISKAYARKSGLPYINFYTDMPNERSYVVSRIRKFI